MRAPLLLPLLSMVACASGTVVPKVEYHSSHYVQRIPVSAVVDATVTSLHINGTLQPESERVLLADALRKSFEADLERNGPLWLTDEHPRVVVELSVEAATTGDTTAWRYVPPFILGLFGLPTYSTKIVLTGTARVLAGGEPITQIAARGECTSLTGLYYNWSVELGCAAEALGEKIRRRLGDDGARILAATKTKRTDVIVASTTRSLPAPRSDAVVAVFDVQDPTGRLDLEVHGQLSEYVAVKTTEVIGFRVVPRDRLREQIREQKHEGYKSCYDESCQIELGKALAAAKSLSTRIIHVGDRCTVAMTLYDLTTETTEGGATASSPCDPPELLSAIDRALSQLAGTVVQRTR